MNRSIANVIIGGWGEGSNNVTKTKKGSADTATQETGTVTKLSSIDVSKMLTGAKSVIIVPGYGMAVAKAQFALSQLATKLQRRGVKVRFAIHPVAGRLPGHMNVSEILIYTVYFSNAKLSTFSVQSPCSKPVFDFIVMFFRSFWLKQMFHMT